MVEEINVVKLETCNDPLKYATLRAEPDWNALGPRLKKDLKKVATAVKEMDLTAITDLQEKGTITLEGYEIRAEEIKVLQLLNPAMADGSQPFCSLQPFYGASCTLSSLAQARHTRNRQAPVVLLLDLLRNHVQLVVR